MEISLWEPASRLQLGWKQKRYRLTGSAVYRSTMNFSGTAGCRGKVGVMEMSWLFALPVLVFGAALSAAAERVEVIAHRGASNDAPENTVAAAKLAWEQNADAVEVDIHLSKDKRIIVIHDYDTKRVAGVDKKVNEQTFEELRKLEAGSWKAAKWAGEKLPSLEEVIATVPPGKKLVIEIKSGVDTVEVLENTIRDSPKRGQFVVIAFSFDVAREAKKRLSDLPVYWLWGFSEREKKEYGNPSLDDLIAKAKGAGLDGLDLNCRGPLTKEFVADVERAAMEVIVYTVDDPLAAEKLVEMGVAGITTNRPAFLREQLAGGR